MEVITCSGMNMNKRYVGFVVCFLVLGSMGFVFENACGEGAGKPAPRWQAEDYWLYRFDKTGVVDTVEIDYYNDSNQNGQLDEGEGLGKIKVTITQENYYDNSIVEQVQTDLQKYKVKWDYSYWANGTWTYTPNATASSAPYNLTATDGNYRYHEWTNTGSYTYTSTTDIAIVGTNYNFGFEENWTVTTTPPDPPQKLLDMGHYSFQGTETQTLSIISGRLEFLRFPITTGASWPMKASTKIDWSGTVNYYNQGQTVSFAGYTERTYDYSIVVADNLDTRTVGAKQITDNYKLHITGMYSYNTVQTAPKPGTASGTRTVDRYNWYSPTVGYWVSYNNTVNLTDYKYTPNIPPVFKEKEQFKDFDAFEGEVWTKVISVEDPDVVFGDSLSFKVSIAPQKNWINITKQTDTDAELKIDNPPQSDVGDYVVNVSVADLYGGMDYIEFKLHLKNKNDAPYVKNPIKDIVIEEGKTWAGNQTYGDLKLSEIFDDKDLENPAFGDSLNYNVSGNGTVHVTIDKTTTKVTLYLPDKTLDTKEKKITM
ncbi:MAG: hypothetical protein AB1779_01510, partial [Candidatus Thermoplasmatota archaeon]